MIEILPFYAREWTEDAGYVPSGQLLGYQAIDARGEVIAFGESRSEALENALEVQWPTTSEGGMSAGAVVTR